MAIFSVRRRSLLGALYAGLVLSAPNLAHAWPDAPVRLIVPAPPGGTMDVVARMVSDELARDIHQPVIVENKPGAGGVVAVQALRSAPPDGKTLMITASNLLTEAPLLIKVNFDPFRDIVPVAVVARTPLVLVGSPSLKANDLKALVAHVKANPGKTSFASYSTGTVSHYAGMILNQKAGLDMQHVPFAGSPPALSQVMGGQIPIMFDGIPTSLPMIAAGKLKAYGVTSKTRSPFMPNVPTLAEQGYPELDFNNWVGLVAASNVPPGILEKVRVVMERVGASPRVKGRLAAQGFEAAGQATPDQLAQQVRTDYDRNAAIVKTFDIKAN